MSGFNSVTANLIKNRDSWKTSAFIMTGIVVFCLWALFFQKTNEAAYIISYEHVVSEGKLKVTPAEGTAQEYLALLASADISSLLNWKPKTVLNQYSRFLNRTSPEFYAQNHVRLINEANDHSDHNRSQTFYVDPMSITVRKGNKVLFTGELNLWEGDVKVFSRTQTFQLTYLKQRGFYTVLSAENLSNKGEQR